MQRVIGVKVSEWRGRMAVRPHVVKRLLTAVRKARTVRYTNFGKTFEANAQDLKGKTVLVGDEKVVVA